jgi:Flp pilus assembly protein TadG
MRHMARRAAISFRRRRTRRRSGVTVVESAFAIILTLSVVFTVLDLGLLAFQSNMLSLAARRLARESIVRGGVIEPTSAWGPASLSGTAADGSPEAQVVLPYCTTMTPSKVKIAMTWPDGSNGIDDRVNVQLNFQRQPMTPLTSWLGKINLYASTVMKIVH